MRVHLAFKAHPGTSVGPDDFGTEIQHLVLRSMRVKTLIENFFCLD